MTRLVLFDLDGTLADSAPDLAAALNAVLTEEGRAPLPFAMLRPHVSGGARALLGAGFAIKPDDADYPRLRERFLACYEQDICAHTRLFDGMAELLAWLEQRGTQWGIVTNKIERYTCQVVAALGLAGRAACVVSGDSTPTPKPHPAPLLLACQQAGATPDSALYLGDDLRDVQAGRAAGTRTVVAAWGYLGDGPPPEEWGADAIIERPEQLLQLL